MGFDGGSSYRPVTRFSVFGEQYTFFRRGDFLYYMFKTNFSGHKNLGVHNKIVINCPKMPSPWLRACPGAQG